VCPFYQGNGVHALQRFHHKEVIGAYLGREHPSQPEPFVAQGWPRLFDPDHPDIGQAQRQQRCPSDDEWSFFTDFYLLNDFAGIQLAPDRFPPGCGEEFYRRFGAPVGEVTIRGARRSDAAARRRVEGPPQVAGGARRDHVDLRRALRQLGRADRVGHARV
jgi:hypothetical protein